MKRFLLVLLSSLLFGQVKADEHLKPAINNPLLPGYFADPTVKKFGDTYYIYSTTDGVKLASGQPTVWMSKDFTNWYNQEMQMELPEGLTNCWAPDVVERNGSYYYYMGNCQFGCNIYGYVADTPIGPWTPVKNGEPVIPVGTGKEHLPALDAQFFVDDDGSMYAHFGTWCTSFGGVGWAKIDTSDMATITESGLIPIEQVPHLFEASYMIKRNGKYILMYSAGDCKIETYAVHYAWADSPTGPFHYGTNNPILETNHDATIDGPGHHSMLKEGDDYYIVYHRHDNPHSTGGMFRQTCVDKMVFENDTIIAKIKPSHTGIAALVETKHPVNIALDAAASASSEYHMKAPANRYNKAGIDHVYQARYATDNNNGTLWKAADACFPQSLTIDLGRTISFKRIVTEFEYPTFYYQYTIETSKNGKSWKTYADRSRNNVAGGPMIDDNEAKARYLKITISGAEKTGLMAAIWNIKVYNRLFELPAINNLPEKEVGECGTGELLVDFDASKAIDVKKVANKGALGGTLIAKGKPVKAIFKGVEAIKFDGESYYRLSEPTPNSLNWSAPFTASVWVNNPTVDNSECVMVWNTRRDMLQGSYAAFMYCDSPFGAVAHGDGATDLAYSQLPEAGEWHNITLTFDGMKEIVYVDGKLNTEMPMNLFVTVSDILIGASGMPSENFTGYISRAMLYNKALSHTEIEKLILQTHPLK